ncbi:MAG TPA: 3-deoxy-manno-octulosonate cytidylyltransferase [Gammaproteobacteria bacterium]|nr:3-deoxy-manno-octulosonate cytidylyltransferase [Gammaproteobacteria bacterium]
MSPFRVVIPARFGARRLPGKPLRLLKGRPLIEHVYGRARAAGADEVIVATDSNEVRDVAEGFGADVCMTATTHQSGTERLAEVVARRGFAPEDIVVNVQGDEPCIPPELIRQTAAGLAEHPDASIATLCERITTTAELFDPNVVKVVRDQAGYGMYFSRAVIPWDREAFAVTTEVLPPEAEHYRHIGLYAYRAGFLPAYVQWGPCPPECLEHLEQLRALWHGRRIYVDVAVSTSPPGVDTEADLARMEALL